MNTFVQQLIDEGFIYQNSPTEKFSEDSNYSHSLISNNYEHIKDFLLRNGFIYSQRKEKVLSDVLTFEVFQRNSQQIQYRNQQELINEGYLEADDYSTQFLFSGF